ncbi:MAG: His/Gly/Thr/Pro-type tRNA ligase C-terminal domain-containing protein [bacterium]|nr:His/Gly/Thr/Pro-type tRNA ligase C-terminal domain-containing protein [bacterium]
MTQRATAKETKSNEYWIYPNATNALEIALYYGFTPHTPVSIEKADLDFVKGIVSGEIPGPHILPQEEISILRSHFVKGQPQLPLMIIRERKEHKRAEYIIEAIGTSRSIADVSVIKTAYEILRSEGYENIELEVNSLGDKDSFARFNRELTAYFRKHITELDPECRQKFKKGAIDILTCEHEGCQKAKHNAPKPMNYLSESSRTHFKEVLEMLEMSSLPFTINSTLLDNCEFASQVIFKMYVTEEGKKLPTIIGRGARWAGLAKKIGIKKDVPGVTAVICVKKPQEIKPTKIRKPQFYFIQMGQEAKLRSLTLIEILRQEKIPVYHSLTKDKLSVQLMSAEHLRVPFLLIMGQKESIENTVLIREMSNRSQETIKITQVCEYIKKLIK